MKLFVRAMTLAAALLLLSGCARELIVSEVLQIPEHAVIRTAYNLWYEDPMKMDTINTQKGRILPFGTPVEITKATDAEILFRTADGQKFRIEFEPHYRLQSPEEYMRDLFTIHTESELKAGFDTLTYEKIRRGVVEKGMSKAAVIRAYGPPCAFRTASQSSATWLYPAAYLEYKRIIFKNGKILDIILP